MQNKEINIKVSTEEIRANLERMIGSDHSKLISEVIVGNLAETEVGLQQVYKAMSGIRVKITLKVGDEVSVLCSALATWYMNKDKMKAAKMIFKDRVDCHIISINRYKEDSIEVEYDCMDGSDVVTRKTSSVRPDECLPGKSEFIENLEDDTPF